ncbi:unnamed protein product [Sympodiomycopsis kandeliae]
MAKKGNRSSTSGQQHAPATTDPRFARLQSDPRFLRAKKDDSKVVIDDRFKALLRDGGKGEFGINKRGGSKVNRFGRKAKQSSKDEEEMKRLYKLEAKQRRKEEAGEGDEDQDDDQEEEEESSDSEADDETGEGGFVDYARGGAELESSSDEDSDEDSDEGSSSASSGESDSDVEIGTSAALRREQRRKAAHDDEFASSGEEDQDDMPADLQALDPRALAALDAQAAAAIRQEAEDSDEEGPVAGPSSTKAGAVKPSKNRKRQPATVPLGEETRRLAVVNMDWDHVRSLDLYKVFSSLVSPVASRAPGTHATPSDEADGRRRHQASTQVRGTVESVRVYVSEFGKERMKKEDLEGPPKDIFKGSDDSSSKKKSKNRKGKGKRADDDSEEEENDVVFEVDDGAEFDEEALRKYQLERLHYYYAVATFDSPLTARHVYDEVDGTEMERTANVFDLQFVPDDIEFADHQGDDGWRDEARPGVDDGVAYKGVDWSTAALRHSKVRLTWDAPDPERQKITRRANLTKDQIRDEDFKAYLASDSEPSDEEEEEGSKGGESSGAAAHREKMRALLGLSGNDDDSKLKSKGKGRPSSSAFQDAGKSHADDDQEQGDMEITFMPGLSEAAGRRAAAGKQSELTEGEETTLEKYLRKQREKKASRKAAAMAKNGEDNEADDNDDIKTSSLPQPKESDLGFDDPFFASDGGEDDFDEMLERERSGKSRNDNKKPAKKDAKKPTRQEPIEAADDGAESLDEDGTHRNHFSMQDIIKSESKKGKKLNRWEKKKAAKNNSLPQKASLSTQDDFAMNVSDPRFKAVMDDHQYSIDPSHPGFVQTSGMKKLLDEKRKRGSQFDGEQAVEEKKNSNKKQKKSNDSGNKDEEASEMLKSLKARQNQQPQRRNGKGHAKKVK